jgi:hypothetical protein
LWELFTRKRDRRNLQRRPAGTKSRVGRIRESEASKTGGSSALRASSRAAPHRGCHAHDRDDGAWRPALLMDAPLEAAICRFASRRSTWPA